MYKIKQYDYDITPKIGPDVKVLAEEYVTEGEAEQAALALAVKTCAELNDGSNSYGNYFEVAEYQEMYSVDGENCTYYPVSVLWFDHAPEDRENDCNIRTVVGYEVFRVAKNQFRRK